MIGPEHQKHFSAALAELLGEPIEGAVAFLRCLPSEQVEALADAEHFAVAGWTVNAVVDMSGHRRVTADQAVERREDKADAMVFLIDTIRAGAGLDGIYSAAREIGEVELFRAAQRHARRALWGRLPTIDAAMKRAGSCRECGGNCRAASSGHVTMAPVRPRGQGTLAREAGTEFPSHRPFASGSDRKPAAPRAASARFRRRAARFGS